ncbi:MAG: DNA translocase FtsK 4TM domain-containing protein [Clostridia bacterium]
MGRKKSSMAATRKRKPSSNRSNTRIPKAKQKTIGTDMLGGFFVVIALVLAVFYTFSNIGVFADVINNISKGLFGNIVFIFPVTLAIVGIYIIASEKKIKVSKQVFKGILVMCLMCATVYSFSATNFNIFNNFVKFIVNEYNAGLAGTNFAGVIGAVLASLSVKVVGSLATKVILTCVTFVTILCVFDISFKQLYYYIYNAFAYIYNGLYNVFSILFRKDEVEDEDEDAKYSQENIEPKLSKRELRKKEKLEEKMREKASLNADENLKVDKAEQVEFDFNKLGGRPTDQEMQAKMQRDDFFKKQREEKEDKTVKEVLTLDHTKYVEVDNYEFPSINLLGAVKAGESFNKKAIHDTAVKLQKTLASFGVEAKVTNITKGPTVTRYELTPSTGVKVSKIVNLSDDIALNLAAKTIRIEAPIPGKAAVGIEVPNSTSESVMLREVIESKAFSEHKSKIAFSLGKDAAGDIVVGDIAKMPHTLIAGATGSGKSVCINALIVSILYKAKPSEVKMILIDPKMVELSGYNGIPHLLIPVVTDPKKAAGALNWAVQEMVNRYNLFASKGVKDIKGYNLIMEKDGDVKLPQIVIIIDELADLMMVAPNDVEEAICRLAQMARAAGMHLVIATQRPSVDVITGIIKANIPSRIAFTVSSQIDSRTILDMAGAEKLLGKGDMLYFPTGETKPHRIQGAFISEKEIEKIVESIKKKSDVKYSEDIIKTIEKAGAKDVKGSDRSDDDSDVILEDAIDLVIDMGQASASMLQRKFKIGYSRAGRIVDQMEERGLVSGYDGSKPRQVLISKAQWQELKLGKTSQDENQDSKNEN